MISDIINDILKNLKYIKFHKSTIFPPISFKSNHFFSFKYKIIFVFYFILIINDIVKNKINELNTNEIN